ncbi:hypothetical protein A3F66_04155 [candidate division TM6 bacterium RIFCSPHIGHO2_12_FULL_32_22]|nr:MAG: hypothetical protein A3F66_04155 [candidate division TM6 bacterium RIFCSPHIGHO2_12_FULL_32_22]
MFNELIFFGHILVVSIFAVIALKLKKEALIALICVQAILANVFVTKQMIFYGFCVTCTDIFTVGISLCLNFLQEYYDKKLAQKTIWISFFCLIFYLIMSQIHLLYLPAEIDIYHKYFMELFAPMPRIIIASMFAYLISQYIDTNVYSFLKTRINNFVIRNYGSIFISQLVDTVLFSFLGLYGIVHNIWHIIFVSFLIKLISIIIIVPLSRVLLRYSHP